MSSGSRPLETLCVEITARCPLRCIHCSACASPQTPQQVTLASFRAYLANLPHLREVYLSGGEPFEHPDLEDLVVAATAKADRVVLYSSGTIVDARGVLTALPTETLECLAPRARGVGIRRIDLSIYSRVAERHESITATRGSLAVTLKAARRIRACGIDLGVHYVPLMGVEDCLPGVAALARELGATRLHILAPVRHGRALQLADTRLSPRTIADLRSLLSEDLPLKVVISSVLRRALGLQASTVRDRWRTGFVDVRGHFYPGEGFREPGLRGTRPVLANGDQDPCQQGQD